MLVKKTTFYLIDLWKNNQMQTLELIESLLTLDRFLKVQFIRLISLNCSNDET